MQIIIRAKQNEADFNTFRSHEGTGFTTRDAQRGNSLRGRIRIEGITALVRVIGPAAGQDWSMRQDALSQHHLVQNRLAVDRQH